VFSSNLKKQDKKLYICNGAYYVVQEIHKS